MQDQEALQALQQVFEQGLQIIQSMAGDGDDQDDQEMPDQEDQGDDDYADGEDPYAMDDDEGAEDEMPPDDQGMPPEGGEDDEYPDDDEDMDQKPLGKRVADLEEITGFKKSARSGHLLSRIEDLEFNWLGDTKSGNVKSRLSRLEKEAGVTRASDESPDVIQLDQLIKSAAQQGAKAAIAQMKKSGNQELPHPEEFRKSAQAKTPNRGKRQAPKNQSYEALAKSLGYEEGDLDKEVGFGDALMMQYHAQQNGSTLFEEDD